MSSLFVLPRQFVIDGAGDPRAGAQLFFYEAGTLTLQDTYSDDGLTTPNTNPVVADSAGQFGPIYLANTAYRAILKDSADVQIWDQDDINAPLLGLFGSDILTKSGNYTVTTDDKGSFIEFTATATASLPAVADAAAGFTLAIWSSGSGTVTIDPDSTELINGGNSLVLDASQWALLTTDGSAWIALVNEDTESGSFTPAFTGFSADPSTPSVSWVRQSRMVIAKLEFTTGTSAATNFLITNVPAAIQQAGVRQNLRLMDNGANSHGAVELANAQWTFCWEDAASGGFTASGTKGLSNDNQTIVYFLD